ncbi:MAG: hypothetical protein Q7J79_00485 [Gemmatimonadales bacterium]|nr:hypothetical protein [Gemmatimonadales bacterium]
MLIFWVLLAAVVLRAILVAGFACVLIPRGRKCPACGADTVPIHATGLVRLLPGIGRRWCMTCGWSWYRKHPAPEPAAREAPRIQTLK